MAFTDARVTVIPGGNAAPGIVIVSDPTPTVTSAAIAASTSARTRTYFSRINATPNMFKAGHELTNQDLFDFKKYEGILAAIRGGRANPQTALTNNESKNSIGAILIAIGNDAPVMKRLAVVNPGVPNLTGDPPPGGNGLGGFYDPTVRVSVPANPGDPVGIGVEAIWVI